MSEQQPNDSTVAGGNAPTSTPSGSDIAAQIAALASERDQWKNRYNGQQAALTKKAEELNTIKAQHEAVIADYEGYKGTTAAQQQDWEKKISTFETEKAELAKKLSLYDLEAKVRSTIYSEDFKPLAPEFETDPIFKAGLLTVAQQADEAGLKTALKQSLDSRKGRTQAALDQVFNGASTPPPTGGQPAATTEAQLQDRLGKTTFGTPEWDTAWKAYQEFLDKNR